MAVLVGAVLAVMAGVLLFLVWTVFNAALLRLLGRLVAGAEIGWPAAAGSVVLASIAQGCASGVLGGADGGLIGFVVGLVVWSGVVSFINGIELGKAVLVGLAMSIVTWVLIMLLVVGGLLAVFGAAVGAGLAA
jgi:hypothetical protein